jgi:hypothetical protein
MGWTPSSAITDANRRGADLAKMVSDALGADG